MVKSVFKIIASSFLCLSAFAASCNSESNITNSDNETIAEAAGYTDRMEIPLKDLTCHNGGPGTRECKIEPGIKIGDFVSIGCGVTCEEGFYACCGVRCACVPEE